MNTLLNNRSKSFWGFLAPCLLGTGIVLIIPLLVGIFYSFTEWNGNNTPRFVGLQNYVRAFSDQGFLHSLLFTGEFTLVVVLLINIIGLALALLVTQKLGKINTFFRTVFFAPNLIGGIILGFIWQFIFTKAFDTMGQIFNISSLQGWLSNTTTGFWGLVILYVWQMSGYIMIIYISFLNNISDEILEAAQIDGVNSWQMFLKIKFPLIAPGFTISLFLTLSNAFKLYDQNLALTAGGPFNSTQMAAMNIYNEAFTMQNMGYAQAKAVIFLIIITIISVIQIMVSRKREVSL